MRRGISIKTLVIYDSVFGNSEQIARAVGGALGAPEAAGILQVSMVKIGGYAAKPMAEALAKKGGVLVTSPEGFYVQGEKGPLKDGELERAANWARRIQVQCQPR